MCQECWDYEVREAVKRRRIYADIADDDFDEEKSSEDKIQSKSKEDSMNFLGMIGSDKLYQKHIDAILSNKWIDGDIMGAWTHIQAATSYECMLLRGISVANTEKFETEFDARIWSDLHTTFLKRRGLERVRTVTVPIHVKNMNWSLVYVDLENSWTLYVDSQPVTNLVHAQNIANTIVTMLNNKYLDSSLASAKNKWTHNCVTSPHVKACEQNPNDVGVYMCKFFQMLCVTPIKTAHDLVKVLQADLNVASYRKYMASMIQDHIVGKSPRDEPN